MPHPRHTAAICVAAALLHAGTARAVEVLPVAPEPMQPGAPLIVAFHVVEASRGTLSGEVTVPDGWTLLMPEEPFNTESGQAVRLVAVVAPERERAGTYDVTYDLRDGESTARGVATVVVPARPDVALDVRPERALVLDTEEASFTWRITNHGNVDLVVDLSSRDTRTEVEGITLAAGASTEGTWRAKPQPGRDRLDLRLEASDAATGAALAVERASVEVASGDRRVQRFRTLPASVTAWGIVGKVPDSPVRATAQGEVEAAGALDADGDLQLDLKIRTPGSDVVRTLRGRDEYRLALDYDRPGWRLYAHGGDRPLRLGELVLRGNYVRGAEVGGAWGPLSARAILYRPRWMDAATWSYGGVMGFDPSDRVHLGVQTLWTQSQGRPGLVVAHDGRIALIGPPIHSPTFGSGARLSRPSTRGAPPDSPTTPNRPDPKAHRLTLTYQLAQSALNLAGHADLRGTVARTRYWALARSASVDYAGEGPGTTFAEVGGSQGFGERVTFTPRVAYLRFGAFASDTSRQRVDASALFTARLATRFTAAAGWQRFASWGPARATDDRAQLSGAWSTRTVSLRGLAEVLHRSVDDGNALSARLSLGGNLRLTNALGVGAQLRLQSNYRVVRDGLPGVDAAASTSWSPGGAQRLTAQWQVQWRPDQPQKLTHFAFTEARVLLPWGHYARWNVRFLVGHAGETGRFETDTLLGYEVPLGVPVGKRRDLAWVNARVVDAGTGDPLGGLPIRLDGQTAIGDPLGGARFGTLVDGAHRLDVDTSTLDGQWMIEDPSALRFDIAADDVIWPEVDREIRLVRGGTWRVRLVQWDADPSEATIDGPAPLREAGPLGGARLQVRRGDEVLTLITDPDGWATAGPLRPGEWTLEVPRAALPRDAVLAHEAPTVRIGPGEVVEHVLRVEPRRREVVLVVTEVLELRLEEASDAATPSDRAVAAVRVTPSSMVLTPGDAQRPRVSARYTDGSVEPDPRGLVWRVDDPSIATIEDGFVHAIATGRTRAEVCLGEQSATLDLEVVERQIVGLVVRPEKATLGVGESLTLSARALDTLGRSEDAGAEVTWHSEDPSVATVDSAGRVTALAPGATRILVSISGVNAFPVPIEVTAP